MLVELVVVAQRFKLGVTDEVYKSQHYQITTA